MSFAKSYRGVFSKVIKTTATVDPTSLADAAGETIAVTVPGARLGDFVRVAAPYVLSGITVTAYVATADQVSIRVQNESGGVLNLASGTWNILVEGF